MTMSGRNIGLFALMALLLMSVGFIQSWDVSLTLLNPVSYTHLRAHET